MSEIFRNAGNAYQVDYSSSLLDMKIDSLKDKIASKQQKLTPEPKVTPVSEEQANNIDRFNGGLANSTSFANDLYSLGTAAVDREFNNIKNIASGESNPNLMEEADVRSNVRATVRQELNEAASSGINSLANARISLREGEYLDAAGNVIDAISTTAKVLPELAVDSLTGTIASGIAGTLGTAGIGGLPMLGKKLFRGANAIGDISDAVTDAVAAKDAGVKLNVLQKALAATKSVGKKASQVSLSTAAVLQQNEEAYIKENGEASSVMHKLVNAPAALALMMFDRAIFMSALPSIAGVTVAKNATKQYAKDISKALSPIPKKYSVEVAKRVLKAAVKVSAVGGLEATLEYLQTWHSILQAKMDDFSIRSALDELNEEGNIDEANYSALVGAMVGGGVKGATVAPGVVAGAALDTVVGTAGVAVRGGKKVKEISQDALTKASFELLSETDRAVLSESETARTAIADKEIAGKEKNIDTVLNAKTIDDLLADDVVGVETIKIQTNGNITTEAAADPKQFNSIKTKLISQFRSDQALVKTELMATSVGRVVSKVGTNVVNKSTEKAKKLLKNVPVENLVKTVTALGTASVEIVKNLESSTARGVIELGLRNGIKSSNTVLAAVKDMEINDLTKVISVIDKKHPDLAKKLQKTLANKKQALKNIGQSNDTLTTIDNIKPELKDIAKGPALSENGADSVFKLVSDTINGKVADLPSLEIVEAALDKYKELDSVKKGKNKVSLGVLTNKLKLESNKIRKPVRTEAKAKIAELSKNIKSKGLVEYFKNAESTKELISLLDSESSKDFTKKVKEFLPDLPNMPDMPNLETEEGMAKFDKQLENAYNSVAKTVTDTATAAKELVVGPEKKENVVGPKRPAAPSPKPTPSTKQEAAVEEIKTVEVTPEVQKKRDTINKQLSSFDSIIASVEDSPSKQAIVSTTITPTLPKIITKLKEAGYTNIAEVKNLLRNFTSLDKYPEILSAFEQAFPDVQTEVVMTESFDNEPSQVISDKKKAEALYTKLNPRCKI